MQNEAAPLAVIVGAGDEALTVTVIVFEVRDGQPPTVFVTE